MTGRSSLTFLLRPCVLSPLRKWCWSFIAKLKMTHSVDPVKKCVLAKEKPRPLRTLHKFYGSVVYSGIEVNESLYVHY